MCGQCHVWNALPADKGPPIPSERIESRFSTTYPVIITHVLRRIPLGTDSRSAGEESTNLLHNRRFITAVSV